MLQRETRIILPTGKSRTGIIYIPADIVKDSSFPFQANERVLVRIRRRRLIVESVRRRASHLVSIPNIKKRV